VRQVQNNGIFLTRWGKKGGQERGGEDGSMGETALSRGFGVEESSYLPSGVDSTRAAAYRGCRKKANGRDRRRLKKAKGGDRVLHMPQQEARRARMVRGKIRAQPSEEAADGESAGIRELSSKGRRTRGGLSQARFDQIRFPGAGGGVEKNELTTTRSLKKGSLFSNSEGGRTLGRLYPTSIRVLYSSREL